MKGIILAGGLGTRLKPLTDKTNKHLLPLGNNIMLDYPLRTLRQLGIKNEDIAIVTNDYQIGPFMFWFLTSTKYDNLSLIEQKGSDGIPSAIKAAEDFVGTESFVVVLGDNIIQQVNELPNQIPRMFITPVQDASRYGMLELKGNKFRVREKPKRTSSHWAVMGLYVFDKKFFEFFDQIKPSERGETEISDILNLYIKSGDWTFTSLFCYVNDAGTFESLKECDEKVRKW